MPASGMIGTSGACAGSENGAGGSSNGSGSGRGGGGRRGSGPSGPGPTTRPVATCTPPTKMRTVLPSIAFPTRPPAQRTAAPAVAAAQATLSIPAVVAKRALATVPGGATPAGSVSVTLIEPLTVVVPDGPLAPFGTT